MFCFTSIKNLGSFVLPVVLMNRSNLPPVKGLSAIRHSSDASFRHLELLLAPESVSLAQFKQFLLLFCSKRVIPFF